MKAHIPPTPDNTNTPYSPRGMRGAAAFVAIGLLVCGIQFFGPQTAAVRAQDRAGDAARLGGAELTPVGAERGGNSTGTIPAWTGGITSPPSGYKPGQRHPNPFAEDRISRTITVDDIDTHARHLSEGHQALLRRYPETWRMNVYPTRRSASYPQSVYDAIRRNATSARLVVEGKGGVENAHMSSPFPFPRSGVEVIWNHNLRWRGERVSRFDGMAAVTRRGAYRLIVAQQEIGVPYAGSSRSSFHAKHPNLMFAAKTKIVSPQLLAGNASLALEPINQTDEPRKIWVYDRNLRRIVRSPYDGYADPAPNSEGLRTIDELGLYNGAPDRFSWKILGKREVYIPYNSYGLHGADLDYADLLKKGHIDPAAVRYELHRVWVIEGVLKPGSDHIYSRRVFYVDEDSWQITVSESYDRDGKLWRVAEAHAINYYEVPVHWSTLEVFHDLRARRYLVQGLDNRNNPPRFFEGGDSREFSPIALQYYIR